MTKPNFALAKPMAALLFLSFGLSLAFQTASATAKANPGNALSFSVTSPSGEQSANWTLPGGPTLSTASSLEVLPLGNAQASRIFWSTGSSTSLNPNSRFTGFSLVFADDAASTGTNPPGLLIPQNAANTGDTNTYINLVPDITSTLLFCGIGFVSLILLRRGLTDLNN